MEQQAENLIDLTFVCPKAAFKKLLLDHLLVYYQISKNLLQPKAGPFVLFRQNTCVSYLFPPSDFRNKGL